MRAPLLAILPLVAACAAPAAPEPSSAPMPPPAPAPAPEPPGPPALEVAVTVDDLPVHGPAYRGIDRLAIAERILEVFRAHRLPPVYGFVNGKKVDEDPATEAILRRWIATGNPLGNHTYSHISLNRADLPAYFADLEQGEAILRKLVPDEGTWRVYRYPFLFEGNVMEKREAVRKYLREHGYTTAEVTIDGNDWAFNPPWARCMDKGDTASLGALRERFVTAHVDELRYVRALTQKLAGRDVRHVLLLHVGAAEAEALDATLTAYEREGVRFVELREALADPFYAEDPGKPYPWGSAFPYLLAKARGMTLPPPPPGMKDLEAWLDGVCK
jgi:peptidoglycan/xylan/chitin deacetylase (PgdA/CDA1 family)